MWTGPRRILLRIHNLAVFILYLTCFNLDSFLFRTLAQRAAKRAKAPVIVIEDDPTVSAGGVSETTLTDPATTPQSSPQRSPQRKFVVLLPAVGRAWVLFSLLISCLLICVGAEQPHQEGPEAAPEVSSASTTPPREDSPARERSSARENSPARDSSPARDGTSDPPVVETTTAGPSTGNHLA